MSVLLILTTLTLASTNRQHLTHRTLIHSIVICQQLRMSQSLYIPLTKEYEDAEKYVSGGYYPVTLGEELQDRRYRILYKLGHGGFSTVWLALDQHAAQRCVALKILVAEVSATSHEILILQHLRAVASSHPGYRFLNRLLDDFEIEGPNGVHRCLVLPLAGPSAAAFLEADTLRRRDSAFVRRIVSHATAGLEALHDAGVVHGDMTPQNILLRVPDMETWTEHRLLETFGQPRTTPIRHRSETPTLHAPVYAVQPIDFSRLDGSVIDGSALLADYGESFFAGDPPTSLGIPMPFFPPELFFDDPPNITSAVDIWAWACSICVLRTGVSLFYPAFNPKDDILRDMVATLGKLPDQWWQQWEARSKFFDGDGSPGTGLYAPEELTSLRDQLRMAGVYGSNGLELPEADQHRLSADEVETLGELLSQMLAYRPCKRITAKEVSGSVWLRDMDLAERL